MTPAEKRELAEAPESWRAWWLCRGRLVTLPDGSLDLEPEHELFAVRRAAQTAPRTVDGARRLRGSQDYSTLHLGRGTRWIKPKKNP